MGTLKEKLFNKKIIVILVISIVVITIGILVVKRISGSEGFRKENGSNEGLGAKSTIKIRIWNKILLHLTILRSFVVVGF